MTEDHERKAQESDNKTRDDGGDKQEPIAPSQPGRKTQSGGSSGSFSHVGGNSFHVETISGHAVVYQGIQGESMRRIPGSGESSNHHVGQASGYSTVMQGATSEEFISTVLRNRLERYKGDAFAANESQSNLGEQDPSADSEWVHVSVLDQEKPDSSKKGNSDGSGDT